MKVVLYGINFQDVPFPGNLAVLTTAARNRGFSVKHLNGKYFGRDNYDEVVEPADLAFVSGAQDGFRLIPPHYQAMNVPCLVNDLGWLRRKLGYFQTCPYRINKLYPGDCPTDRFERLDIVFKNRFHGKRILVCGQKGGDAQHDLGDSSSVHRWADLLLHDIRKITDREIVFRPHPRERTMLGAADYWSDPAGEKLDECIHRHDIGLAIMYNSTSAFECLMAGVPIIALGKDCMYRELAGSDLTTVDNPFFPSKDQLVRFFSRVAYHQYTTDELGSWRPIDYLLERHNEHHHILQ
jgi:hypothetical protein